MKKILTVLLLCGILVSVAFAQRTSRPGGYNGRRINKQHAVDPNTPRENTLEERVSELENRINYLEDRVAKLSRDNEILEMKIGEAKKEEAEKKASMTQEERDIDMGYYPMFPEIAYGPKKNSDEYTDGYTDGYNDAYEYEEDYSWIDSWIDSEIESEVGSEGGK